MGMHVSMVLIRADGSEFIETDPRYKSDDPFIKRSYIRGETLHDKWNSQDFLLLDSHACLWHERGLPDWLNAEQREDLEQGCGHTWFTIEELMAVDWDAPLRPWPDPHYTVPQEGTRREKLGEEFVQWAYGLRDAGVVKVALSAS